jgi:hypothetical protein
MAHYLAGMSNPSDTAVSLMVVLWPAYVCEKCPFPVTQMVLLLCKFVLTVYFLTQKKIKSNKNNVLQSLINKNFGKAL